MYYFILAIALALSGCGIHEASQIGISETAAASLPLAARKFRIDKFKAQSLSTSLGVSNHRALGFVEAGNLLHEYAAKQAEKSTELIEATCLRPMCQALEVSQELITGKDLLKKYKSGDITGTEIKKSIEMLATLHYGSIHLNDKPLLSPDAFKQFYEEAQKMESMDYILHKLDDMAKNLFHHRKITAEEFVTGFKKLIEENHNLFSNEESKKLTGYLDNGIKPDSSPT